MPRTMLPAVLLLATSSLAFAADPKAPQAPPPPPPPAAAPAPAAAAPAPAPAVVVKTVEPIHALVIPMKGSYQQHGDAFMQLGSQLGTQGKRPMGAPFSRFFNNANEVAEAELLWEVGFPVGPDVKAAAPMELKDIPGGVQATLAYEGAPDGIEGAATGLMRWIETNGYRPAGPMAIFFMGEPGPAGMSIELRLPVTKAQ